MKEIRNLSEVINIAEELPSDDWVGGWFYRGQSIKSWDLIPKAYREPHNKGQHFDYKYSMWLRQSFKYPDMQYENEFEAMAIAQHHGFPTKYLDWSSNILIAAFFACSDNLNLDGRLFAYFPTHYVTEPDQKKFNDYENVVAYQPRAVSSRVKSQSGNFTYHRSADIKIIDKIFEPTGVNTLHDWVIPAESKIQILNTLDRLAVNFRTLFPDLDGLSRHHCLLDLIENSRQQSSVFG